MSQFANVSSNPSWPSTDANGVPLTDLVSICHQGILVVFARQVGAPVQYLYYNVRIPGSSSNSPQEWLGWNQLNMTEPSKQDQPIFQPTADEKPLLRLAGMDLITVPPIVTEAVAANAPFCVVSDTNYISCFRLSGAGTIYVDRFLLVETPVTTGAVQDTPSGQTTWVLKRPWEVRYRRSERRDVPSGSTDTLDSRNMLGEPFLEPTTEIPVFKDINSGQFAVILAPTSGSDQLRWHFFVVAGTEVLAVSFARDESGRVDVSSYLPTQSFSITPLVQMPDGSTQPLICTNGVAAAIYHEQEPATSGGGGTATVRRATRLMLAVPVGNPHIGLPSATAIFDFLVQSDGTIPSFPTGVGCILIDGSLQNASFTPLVASSYPVPANAVHVVGNGTVYGLLLGQPQPSASPLLFDSTDGLVHCYFAGPPSLDGTRPFLVAQYSPIVTRATLQLPWLAGAEHGTFNLVAQRSGTTFNQLAVNISDCNANADLCDITIDYGQAAFIPQESWRGLPRDLNAMLAILNGQASADAADPTVISGDRPFYNYYGSLFQARLPLGSASSPTGFLTLVTHRPDVQLASVSVGAPSGATTTIIITYTLRGVRTATQTWASVPIYTTKLAPILLGDASAATYPYAGAPADTPSYGISTDAGTILLFGASAVSIEITISAAADLNPAHCNVRVQAGTNNPTILLNLRRDQADFVTALEREQGISTLFSYISPDSSAGSVTNQTVGSRLDLRDMSILFDVLAPAVPGVVVQAVVNAAVLQSHTLTSPPPPDQPPVNAMIALAALAPQISTLGQTALVQNATDITVIPPGGQNGAWVASHVPQALRLVKTDAMSVSLSTHQARDLAPGRTFTVEAWVMPEDGNPSRVVAYNSNIDTKLAGVIPSYFLGTAGLPSLEYEPYEPKTAYGGSYINVATNTLFQMTEAPSFTWEAWVKPDSPPSPVARLGCVVQGQATEPFPAKAQFQLGVTNDLLLTFGYRAGERGAPWEAYLSALAPLSANTWTHVAVTGFQTNGFWTFNLYTNAQPAANQSGIAIYPSDEAPFVCIGACDFNNVSLFGSIAEVRFWKTARSAAELHRTMSTSLTGVEPGLLGYWPLTVANVFKNEAKATGAALDGALRPKPEQTVKTSSDGSFLSIIAGVGGALPIEALAFLRANHWNHIAVVYEAAGALSLNPPSSFGSSRLDYGVCKNASGLNISNQGSLEVWVQMNTSSTLAQTILAQWGSQPSDQAFQFAVGSNSAPYCTVTVLDPATQPPTPTQIKAVSSGSVIDEKPHHVVATYSSTTTTDNNGVSTTTCTLSLYVDGQPQASTSQTFNGAIVQVLNSSANFTVGISALATASTGPVALETQGPFRGVLTGIRFWSIALTAAKVKEAMDKNRDYDAARGVVSAWWFDEQSGTFAADSVSENDLTLSDTDMWAAFASISTVSVFGNGLPVARVFPATSDKFVGYIVGGYQFTAGAYISQGLYHEAFKGALAELRLWSIARSRDQLLETIYRGLLGSEQSLKAYWTFDGTCQDMTGRGNNGTLSGIPSYIHSTAPVANEGPAVRNVYNGPITDFQEPLTGTAAVSEYADTERRDDDTSFAVMRRGYFYNNPNWTLFTGYGLGELDLVYIGQVQTNPTLLGFIEGAPPVPSENLSRPLYQSVLGYNSYMDCSLVSLTEGQVTSFTFSSSDYRTSITMDLDVKLGVFWLGKINVGTPFFKEEIFHTKYKIGGRHKSSLLRARQSDQKYVSSWTHTLVDTMSLRGVWEPQETSPAEYVNPLVGRRYQPVNIGYALVESLTADLFSMQMRTTGAMVGRVAIPDLELPPDKNILVFKINPKYVKNGTLDGKVGLCNDPDYPEADVKHGSYFKPVEAYLLKATIEKQEEKLRAYFDQFDAVSKGETREPDLGDVPQQQFYDFNKQSLRKDIVNSYVWSAYGGLYKSEEQFASSHERTFTGFYSYTHGTGLTGEFDTAVKIGVFGGVDLLLGGQIKIQVAKTEAVSDTLSMSVSVPGDPMLLRYDPVANDYSLAPCPGKVESYRFMTFYLHPSADNADTFLNQVVDQNWLQYSSDPNAIALRGAQSSGNPVWRVLHRVTYVNRVPPWFDTNPAQTVSGSRVEAIEVADNLALIDMVHRVLGTTPPTAANIGAAVAMILAPSDGTSPSKLGGKVPWWEVFLNRTRGSSPDPEKVALMHQILTDVFHYIQTGYATGVLPLRLSGSPVGYPRHYLWSSARRG